MKAILIFILSLTPCAFAKSVDQKEAEKTNYRNAKAICLMNDTLLRGKRLKECIEKEMERNRRSDLEAKNRARKTH